MEVTLLEPAAEPLALTRWRMEVERCRGSSESSPWLCASMWAQESWASSRACVPEASSSELALLPPEESPPVPEPSLLQQAKLGPSTQLRPPAALTARSRARAVPESTERLLAAELEARRDSR
jgi:hypothetical protein